MKKVFFAIFFTILFVSVQAQEDGGFKPTGGFVVGINFTPFNGANMVSIDDVNVRYFLSSDLAIRAGLGLDFSSNNDDNGETGNAQRIFTSSSSLVTFTLGAEKHMTGTDRLSPYAGAEFGIAMYNVKAETLINGITNTYTGVDNGTSRKYTGLGFNLVLGADYYIAKHVYLGAEIGVGFVRTTMGDYTTKINGTEFKSIDKSVHSNFGHNFKPALCLGFKF